MEEAQRRRPEGEGQGVVILREYPGIAQAGRGLGSLRRQYGQFIFHDACKRTHVPLGECRLSFRVAFGEGRENTRALAHDLSDLLRPALQIRDGLRDDAQSLSSKLLEGLEILCFQGLFRQRVPFGDGRKQWRNFLHLALDDGRFSFAQVLDGT